MAKQDYYDVLDISKDASDEDIRKAFRKKAMQYHPDRNKNDDAAEKFKSVNEAYHVLSDQERRNKYDQFGHAGVGEGNGNFWQGFEGSDIFGGVGDIFDSFFGGFGSQKSNRPQRGDDLEALIDLSFEEAVFGSEKSINIRRVCKCDSCSVTGSETGYSPVNCSNCKGSGQVKRSQSSLFGQFVQVVPCPNCEGKGTIITNPCKICNKLGYFRKESSLIVTIPAGIDNGMKIRLSGEGNVGFFGGPSGNLYVEVRINSHKDFIRYGKDLIYHSIVNIFDASIGSRIQIPTLGEPETLNIPPGTQNDAVFILKGKGITDVNGGSLGNIKVIIKLVVPTKLTSEQKTIIKNLADNTNVDKKTLDKRNWFGRIKDSMNS